MSIPIETVRHSLADILADAVQGLFPGIKLGAGAATENGFYFDFDFANPISPNDLPKIEKKMKTLLKEGINPDAFKLTKIAGAYLEGDEKNKMLTRIYGLAFATKKELDGYLFQQQEAEKRDHRVLGQKLDLFIFDDEVGQGLPLWLPKGALLRKLIMDFAIDTYLENGYELVSTPHIASSKLWSHSGHIDFYKDGLYDEFGIEGEMYRLKPMNCPLHVAIYKSKLHSYKKLPIRWTEMGTVYRYERSGTLHGLTRVRGFTQDDAHIICAPEQLQKELIEAFKLTLHILKTFGFTDFEPNLSTRDIKNKNKFIGSDKDWETAEAELKNVLRKTGYGSKYVEDKGGAVFYGPKIDIKVADAIGRKWQLSTIQFDFNLPSRFQMVYIGEDGKEHTPFMIHRALLGSLERFIGVLLEHYAGALPFWLSPVQCLIIPISDKHLKYAEKIKEQLGSLRVGINKENETMGKKIREGEMQKIPYLLVVGDKEMKTKSVSVRERGKGNLGAMKLSKFLKKVKI